MSGAEIVDGVILGITILNFILINYLLYETVKQRNEKKMLEEILDYMNALDYTNNDEQTFELSNDFDQRIERMRKEVVAPELHPDVKNIPHEEVQHHVQKHVRDEVAE